jgi:hypothetical protein
MRENWEADCACGAVHVSVDAPPVWVNACTCTTCQKATGSVMSWTAFFPKDGVDVTGPLTAFSEAGVVTTKFCPTCGTVMILTISHVPDLLGMAVGLLEDPDFPAPENIYWTRSKPDWMALPDGITLHAKGERP